MLRELTQVDPDSTSENILVKHKIGTILNRLGSSEDGADLPVGHLPLLWLLSPSRKVPIMLTGGAAANSVEGC